MVVVYGVYYAIGLGLNPYESRAGNLYVLPTCPLAEICDMCLVVIKYWE